MPLSSVGRRKVPPVSSARLLLVLVRRAAKSTLITEPGIHLVLIKWSSCYSRLCFECCRTNCEMANSSVMGAADLVGFSISIH